MSLVTITSGIGCGDKTIARILAGGLEWNLFDDERLQTEAQKMGLSAEHAKGLDEKAPALFTRLLRLRPQSYQELMEAIVYKVAQEDNAIILGHGAPFLLRDFNCAFHVRIEASLSSRIETLVNEQGLNSKTAEKMIKKSDSDRKGFMQFAFNMNWSNSALYDIVINREKLGDEGVSELILVIMQSGIISSCSFTDLDSMKCLSLAKKVEMVLMNVALNPKNFSVEVPTFGVVHITGIINALESKDRLLDAIKAMPDVNVVTSSIDPEKIHDI